MIALSVKLGASGTENRTRISSSGDNLPRSSVALPWPTAAWINLELRAGPELLLADRLRIEVGYGRIEFARCREIIRE